VAMGALATYLEGLPEVGKAISIVDALKEIHAGFAQDSTLELPLSTDLVAQYLLILEVMPYLSDLLTRDRQAATISLRVNENGSQDLIAVAEKAEAWWRQNGPPSTQARMTGIMYEFARAEDEISRGQIRGIAFALLVIFVLMWAIFRSYYLALLAMLPNVLPLVAVFGLLGLVGIGLDAGLVVSACLVLGIAVDNTIHLVAALKRASAVGAGWDEILSSALARVVVPVISSTLAIGLGFLVLTGSGFAFVRNLGLLVGAVMAVCCAADLILLPALMRVSFGSAGSVWGSKPSLKLKRQVAD
jgi:predicted RND superfamily exporter protein